MQNEKNADTVVDDVENVKGVEDLGKLTALGQPDIKIIAEPQSVRALRPQQRRRRQRRADRHRRARGDAGVRGREGVRSDGALAAPTTAARSRRSARSRSRRPTARWCRSAQVADIEARSRARRTSIREDGQRYTPVKFSVRGRDLESTVQEAQQQVERASIRGYGKRLEWSGEINELREAAAPLAVHHAAHAARDRAPGRTPR